MSVPGLLDVRLIGGNGTSSGLGNPVPTPQQEAIEREELSTAISKHKHLGAASSCPQYAASQGKPRGKKYRGGIEGLEQIRAKQEPTCAILIKETHLLSHQRPEEAVAKANVQSCKYERKNAAPDTCGK